MTDRRVIDYAMVAATGPARLASEVQGRVYAGWEPVGGPVIWAPDGSARAYTWYQAIVLREGKAP